jgi:Arc/MetJ family transcription regulator
VRTNIIIDDHLLKETFPVSRSKTKKEVIHEALRELIRSRKRKDLTDLAGRISFYPEYNHKTLRKTR